MESTLPKNSEFIIADPNHDSRVGLKEMLRRKFSQRNIEFKDYAANTAKLQSLIDGNVSTIILNPFMPDYDFTTIPLKFRQLYPHIKIILTTPNFSQFLVNCVNKNLFHAYILKSAAPKIYECAIDKVHIHNQPYLHSEVQDKVLDIINLKLPFNEFEWQTFYGLIQLKKTEEIAAAINKSTSSVSTYITTIYQATHTYDLRTLLKYAVQNNFTSNPELDFWRLS